MSTTIDRDQLDRLRCGKFSDLQIRLKDDSIIKAHRAVVCTRSRVLAAAIDGQFKEAPSQEYYMNDNEPWTVDRMMSYMYTLDYDDDRHDVFDPDETDVPEYDPQALLLNAQVYIMAEKYEIEGLKQLACTKYKEVLPSTWNSTLFSRTASLVYEKTVETDRMLRDIIVQGASDNLKLLLDHGDFVEMLKSHGDIATDIMHKVVTRNDQSEVRQIAIRSGLKGVARKEQGKRSSLVW